MFGIYQKKVNFLFIFAAKGGKLNFFHSHFLVIFAWLSVFSGYNSGCKHSFHLENGL